MKKIIYFFAMLLSIVSVSAINFDVLELSPITGLVNGDEFGKSVANISDIDGDGIEDLVVSAQGFNSNTGEIYIVFMESNGSVKSDLAIAENTNGFNQSLQTGEFFGRSVTGLGDLDNDGVGDVAVSAPFYNYVADQARSGAVYILFLNSNGSVKSHTEIKHGVNGLNLTGLSTKLQMGISIENIGDFDDDGVQDIAVGCQDDGTGIMLIMYMNTNGTVKNYTQVTSNKNWDWTIPSLHFMFWSIANIGDLDNDGVTDIAAGAVREGEVGASQRGEFNVLYMNSNGSVKSHVTINETDPNIGFNNSKNNILFGNGLTGIGDINSDGFEDLLVGTYSWNTPNNNVGRADLMYMDSSGIKTNALQITRTSDEVLNSTLGVGSYFGIDMTQIELDGNSSTLEFVVGADEDGAGDTGSVYVFSVAIDDITYQCNDGIDNDGDNLTDYPADPSCMSLNDSSEFPFDYTQCNNGIDDDLDGFIDLADPSCDNATDTSEYPVDASSQQESECYAESLCLFLDQFPYSDTIAAHEWEGNTAQFVVENVFGSNRLDFDNLGFIGFDTTHNITNPNIYTNVGVSFDTYLDKIASTTEHFFIILEDADDRDVLKLRYTLTPTPQTYDISFWNGSAYEDIIEGTVGDGTDSRLGLVMDFDQVLKTWNFTVFYSTGSSTSIEFGWSDVLASKIYKFRLLNGNFSSYNWDFWIDNIYIRGRSEADSICDSWKSPYFLKESFNGKPSDCGWIVNQDVFADGTLEITDSIGFYSMQKTHDLAEEENTRYVTLTYDLDLINISIVGSTLTFRLYDADSSYNFFTVYYRDTGDFLWYNEGGTGKVAGNVTLGVTIPYKFVIDLVDNTYDIYINGSKVVSDSGFSSIFANVENIQHIKIQSNDANYELDNIKIYSSDSSGTELLPDDDLEPVEVDTEFTLCNLFWRNPTSCSTDEECITGKCTVGKCSGFDYNYCDENNHPRTTKCVIYGATGCGLTSFKDLILGSTGNFLLFLLFLVLLMMGVYFIVMVRGRR